MSTRSVVSYDSGSLSGLSSAASTMGIVAANDVFRPTRYHFQPRSTGSHDDSSSFAELHAALSAGYPPELPDSCPFCGFSDLQGEKLHPGMRNLTGEAASAAAQGACWNCIKVIADATGGMVPENPRHHEQQQQQHQQGIYESFQASSRTVEDFRDEYFAGETPLEFDSDRHRFAHSSHSSGSAAAHYYASTIDEEQVTATTVYIGEYNARGQQHGAHGELLWENGDRYVGSFVNGRRTGMGTLFFRDGSVYTGDWLNDQMHGRGQRTFANGDVYVGSYRHGQRSGGPDCKYKFVNGDLYVGYLESNCFHGPGRYFFADGIVLEGHFDHGKKQGKFKRQKANGTLDILRYENDQVAGQGVRWNATRTKTWLLKTVVDKRQHRRMRSDDASQTRKQRRVHQRSLSSPDIGNEAPDVIHEALATVPTTLPSEYDTEPTVEIQEMTMTKKCSRIPIAQAVSIGYDCELGGFSRDTNPAFWTIGDFPTATLNWELIRTSPAETWCELSIEKSYQSVPLRCILP